MRMRDSLADIFQGDEWPELLDFEQTDDQCHFQLSIGAELKWLKGHFPNQPVLPGVVQTHWACCMARHVFSTQESIKRIDNLKFQNVILPPQSVRLELVQHTANAFVTFRYSDAVTLQTFSEGKLIF